MKPITAREQISTVAKRWEQTIKEYCGYTEIEQAKRRSILKELEALDVEVATKEDVAAIIGNPHWVAHDCDECGGRFDALVELSDTSAGEYDPTRIKVCAGCQRKALELIEGGNK